MARLAANVANQPARSAASKWRSPGSLLGRPEGAKLSQAATHALVLPSMGVATGFHRRDLAHPQVRLAQRDAPRPGRDDQLLDRFVQQLGIRGVGDVLLLHGGVHVDTLQIALGNLPFTLRQSDGLLKQLLQAIGPHPLSPPAHARGMDRALVL